MDKVDEKLSVVIDKLTKLVDQHGGSAVSLAVEVTRWSAITNICLGIACLAIAFASAKIAIYLHKKERASDYPWVSFLPYSGPCVLAVILSFASALAAIFILLNFWNFVAAFDPKVGLAYNIMRAAGL